MASISFGSPWLAAGAGLAQGMGQGVLAGAEIAAQRQKAKQQKQHDAMTLLMQGIKNIPDDPQQGEQYMKFFGNIYEKFTGQKVPDMPWAQAKPLSEKMKEAVVQMKQANPNLTDEQAFPYAYQMVTGKNAPKAEKPPEQHYMMTPQGPVSVAPGKYHNVPTNMLPVPYVDPTNPAAPPRYYPPNTKMMPHQAGQVPQTTETESDLSPGDYKKYEALQEQYNATQDPQERKAIEKKIKEAGGTIETIPQPKGFWGGETPPKGMVIPPSTKKRTSVRTPGLGGVPTPAKQKAISEMTIEELKALREKLAK